MAIVKAKCLQCEEEIMIDDGEKEAICPFCGNAFAVKKAIRRYRGEEEEDLDGWKEELAMAGKILGAIIREEGTQIHGFYVEEPNGGGHIEPEEGILQELRDMMEPTLMDPCPAGKGLMDLLAEYQKKYLYFDMEKYALQEEGLKTCLGELMEKEGLRLQDVAFRTLSLNRCEWYEVKGFLGLSTSREKKLVTKELKAVYVSCERLPENGQAGG